jgi:hypothetical protein
VKEGRQLAIQAPGVAALAEPIYDRAGDGVAVFLGEGDGAALGLHAPECIGQRINKLVSSGFHKNTRTEREMLIIIL